MKFSTAAAAATVLATGASAQLSQSSPLQIIGYAQRLLSPACRTAVTTVLASNSSLSSCLQTENLYPILENNSTSVLPNVNDYLSSLCAAPACTPEVISNATQTVLSGCSTELSRFGISNGTVETVMGAYSTARKVACLSSNSTELATNGTSASSNGTFCPIALLSQVEDYLNVSFTNTYVDSLILGANATAYQQLLALPKDTQFVNQLGCNDCVAASVDVVLMDYPQLENLTFKIPQSYVANYTNLPLNNTSSNGTWTVTSLYEGVCAIDVGANATLPASVNETAYNVTIGTNTTSTSLTSSASASTASASISGVPTVAPVSSVPVPTTSLPPVPISGVPTESIATIASIITSAAPAAPTKRFVRWD